MKLNEFFKYIEQINTDCDLYNDLLLINNINSYDNIDININYSDFKNIVETYSEFRIPKITCAILTYNEEKNIYKCISSIYDEFDEILILDSFSNDKTVNIIQTNFPKANIKFKSWEDDFSLSRNILIDSSQNNWIYFIDADNYYNDLPNKFKKAVKLLDFIKFTGIASPIIIEFNNHKYTDNRKLFNKNNNIKFFGKVHEEPLKNNLVPKNITLNISIIHTGYDPKNVDMTKKTLRNIRLTKEMMNLEPQNPKWIFFYCRELYFLDKKSTKDTILLLEKALCLYEISSYKRYFIETLILLCDISIETRNIKVFKNSLVKLNKYFPSIIDTDYYNALLIYLDINRRISTLLYELNNLDESKPSFINSNNEHINMLKLDLYLKVNNIEELKKLCVKIKSSTNLKLLKNKLLENKELLESINLN
ncbi:SunS family peptide S-glycosyltransferase [Clostridium botulinum]|uniref:SunS family peptide S-glycosyltransferase n=1 Tax=Clostridium botulinum TaxID=1491 RepID=UPI000A16D2F2|nr:SunS family peptide S-glycosyltransferase [Clostridium botulinum]OSA65437.1 SunS family peptide S-glycosyltransferase [Clostridium botulinum]